MRFKVGQSVKTKEHSEGVKVGEIGTVITAETMANVELYVVAFGLRKSHYTKGMLEGIEDEND